MTSWCILRTMRKRTRAPSPQPPPGRHARGRKPADTNAAAPLRGKVALVTGGNRGIGFAIAQALAEAGASVVITGRDERTLQTAAARLPKARAVHCDVRDPHSVERLFRVIGEKFGGLDILVNNAGLAHPNREIAKLPLAEWQEVIETNLTGLFLVTRAALLLMRAGGTIVNNLSVAARDDIPGHGRLHRIQARRAGLYPNPARGVAAPADPRHCPDARRHRHGHLGSDLARRSKAQNDIAAGGRQGRCLPPSCFPATPRFPSW